MTAGHHDPGTTGEPKGVMHSRNSLVACTNALAGRFHLTAGDVLLCCSPMGHMTGYAALMLQAVHLASTLVLKDVWEAKRGVAIMAVEGVTHTAASTPASGKIQKFVLKERAKRYATGIEGATA